MGLPPMVTIVVGLTCKDSKEFWVITENCHSTVQGPAIVWLPLSMEPPWISVWNSNCQKLELFICIFASDTVDLSSFKYSLWKYKYFETRVLNGHSELAMGIGFGRNWKRGKHIYDYLFIINNNLGHILPHFTDSAGFLLKPALHPIFHVNFGVFPLY